MKNFNSIIYSLFIASFVMFTVSCSDPDEEIINSVDLQTTLDAESNAMNNAAKAKMYTANLASLNESGVSGTAELTLMGDQLTVKIHATGLEENMLHPQHIHGFTENNRNSKCPTASADNNGDGFVSVGEGVPSYGGVLLPLVYDVNDPLSFPVANAEGEINFEMTYTVDTSITPLQNRAIVLHGMTVEGYINNENETVDGYILTLPVACGQIKPSQGNNK